MLHVNNFGRYLKQEIESSVDERFTRVLWHPEDSSKLILATPCTCAFFAIRYLSNTSHQLSYPCELMDGRRGRRLQRSQVIPGRSQ